MSARMKGVGEALGVLGLILSLLFLGYQVRQANQLARLQVLQEHAGQWRETNLTIASSPELAAALARVFEGAVSADFTPEQNVALRLTLVGVIQGWAQNFKQLQLGVLQPDDIPFVRAGDNFFNNDYLREFWPVIRPNFDQDFAQFWEDRYDLTS